MKNILIILFLFCFQQNLFSQSFDSLKVSQSTYEQIFVFYDKLNSSIIISPITENSKYTIELFDITGLSVIKSDIYTTYKRIEIPLLLKQGVYILIIGNKNFSVTRKFRVH